ncbi:dimethylarginine dimethylaminohydrolase family protein [Chloroflexota bacterium]
MGYKLEDIPFYEPGNPPRYDLWHKVDYLDELEQIWGKKWGANGIGKLREVMLVRPSGGDVDPFFLKDPVYCQLPKGFPDLDRWQRQHDTYAQALRDEGVTVHYMEYPSPPNGVYGPLPHLWAASDTMVVRGGAIIGRYGWGILKKGAEPFIAKWLVSQGCPILLTVIGKGVFEIGVSLCDDVWATALSVAGNQEGLDQVIPVLRMTGTKEILIVHMPGPLEIMENWPAGYGFHLDMAIAALDLGKILLYPPLVDYETIKWLRDRRFEIIEIPMEEQIWYIPTNLVVIEPGRVMMHAGGKETISKVRKAGIEVIEIDWSAELIGGGFGGLACSTCGLVRDPGPSLQDMK